MGDWVIDVCVLDNVDKVEENGLECIGFLCECIRKKERICIDNNGEIIRLYKNRVNINNPASIIGRWWKKIQLNSLMSIIFPGLENRIRESLCIKGFHDDDLIYVEVANKSRNRRIVSVNSDFYIEIMPHYEIKEY